MTINTKFEHMQRKSNTTKKKFFHAYSAMTNHIGFHTAIYTRLRKKEKIDFKN